MNFKLIDNLSNSNNHSTQLKKLFEKSDFVILTSPFLMTDFADFLGEIDLTELKKIHLITTLSPESFDQIKKVSSLISLIEFPDIKDGKVICQISLNNKLHGKIYIFKKENNYISAIISSANFTDSGLSRKHEWGVEIFDKAEIEKLEKSIISSIEFSDLTFDKVYRMQQVTNAYLEQQPQSEARTIDLNLASLILTKNWTPRLDDTIDFWLKPIGVSDDPVTEDRLFNQTEDRLHFSKQRPNGVKPNDIIITCGVGITKMLSVYKVISFPKRVTQEEIDNEGDDWRERWPWYVIAENLTPTFGSIWSKYNLYKNTLLSEYSTFHPGEPITAVGGQTLGALNFGKDKLKLAPGFAKFIIDKIIVINNSPN
jgi:HKD family nuclease